jgi:hypothetical protein
MAVKHEPEYGKPNLCNCRNLAVLVSNLLVPQWSRRNCPGVELHRRLKAWVKWEGVANPVAVAISAME